MSTITFNDLIERLEDVADAMTNHLAMLEENGQKAILIQTARDDLSDVYSAIHELRDDSSNLDIIK